MQSEHIEYILAMCETEPDCQLTVRDYPGGTLFHHHHWGSFEGDQDCSIPVPNSVLHKHGWLTIRDMLIDCFAAQHQWWRDELPWGLKEAESSISSEKSLTSAASIAPSRRRPAAKNALQGEMGI